MNKLISLCLLTLVSVLTSPLLYAVEEVAVDTELQLLLDVSGSVDNYEYQLQLDGYVSAFESTELQQTILGGDLGAIAVQMVMWSGDTQQKVMIDWTLIDSVTTAMNFSEVIAELARPFSGWTAIGEAINYGYTQFLSNGFSGTKNIIDVSGDGLNNTGMLPSDATTIALANGVTTINGIAISTDQRVEDEYLNEVIGGENAFVLVTTDFLDFQTSIDKKLIAEISGTIPQGAISVPAPQSVFMFLLASLYVLFRGKTIVKEELIYV